MKSACALNVVSTEVITTGQFMFSDPPFRPTSFDTTLAEHVRYDVANLH